MATWVFVRHGESTANAEGWLAGHADSPLTPRGRDQARAAAGRVATLRLDQVLSSDLSRAYETATLLVENRDVPIARHVELRERNLGAWERAPRAHLDAEDPHLMRWDLGPPGGEAPWQVARRIASLLANMPDRPTLVVSHGLALKAILGLLDRIPVHTITRLHMDNAQVEVRALTPAAWEDALGRATPSGEPEST